MNAPRSLFVMFPLVALLAAGYEANAEDSMPVSFQMAMRSAPKVGPRC